MFCRWQHFHTVKIQIHNVMMANFNLVYRVSVQSPHPNDVLFNFIHDLLDAYSVFIMTCVTAFLFAKMCALKLSAD